MNHLLGLLHSGIYTVKHLVDKAGYSNRGSEFEKLTFGFWPSMRAIFREKWLTFERQLTKFGIAVNIPSSIISSW